MILKRNVLLIILCLDGDKSKPIDLNQQDKVWLKDAWPAMENITKHKKYKSKCPINPLSPSHELICYLLNLYITRPTTPQWMCKQNCHTSLSSLWKQELSEEIDLRTKVATQTMTSPTEIYSDLTSSTLQTTPSISSSIQLQYTTGWEQSHAANHSC